MNVKKILVTIYSFGVKILAVLKFSWLALVEEVLYLHRTVSVPSDRAFMGYMIRKRAHLLEKQVKGLYSGQQRRINHALIAEQLERDLAVWVKHNYQEDATIKWARQILGEYKSGQPCYMIGAAHFSSNGDSVLDMIKNRRSVRRWSHERLADQEIKSLIDAARWAPSSCNRQTWHFMLVDDSDLISRIAESTGGGYPFLVNAPLLIVVLVDVRGYRLPDERFTMYQDAAAAIQNILIMAQYMGLGACWFSYTSHSNIKKEKEIRQLLGVPDYFRFGGLVAVGRPEEGACVIPRRDLADIVSLNQFGKAWEHKV